MSSSFFADDFQLVSRRFPIIVWLLEFCYIYIFIYFLLFVHCNKGENNKRKYYQYNIIYICTQWHTCYPRRLPLNGLRRTCDNNANTMVHSATATPLHAMSSSRFIWIFFSSISDSLCIRRRAICMAYLYTYCITMYRYCCSIFCIIIMRARHVVGNRCQNSADRIHRNRSPVSICFPSKLWQTAEVYNIYTRILAHIIYSIGWD